MSKNELAATILGRSLARHVRRRRKDELHILAYHRILDDNPDAFLFDEALISACSSSFRRQMEFVKKNFNVLTFADLNRAEKEGKSWPERALIVTFDDGYRDGYTHAFPILKEIGIPATIFLTVEHMAKTELFWWDHVAYCVKKTAKGELRIPALGLHPLSIKNDRERRQAIDKILDYLKTIPEHLKQQFLSEFPELTEVRLPTDAAEQMHLSWDEIREMSAGGIEFGSHTLTHPNLVNIEIDQLTREVTQSKKIIERKLGKEVLAFAYPEGYSGSFNPTVQETVARSGYPYAVAYEEGLAYQQASARYALPRIHVEHENSFNLFRANLMFPNIMLRSRTS